MSDTLSAAAPPINPNTLIEAATKAADLIAKKTDRWWMGFLILVGLLFAGMILWWHREDQRAMSILFAETLKANTEALTRVSTALDRLERRVS